MSFSGLVPHGIYTMWHATAPGLVDLPFASGDSMTANFSADAAGNASFSRSFSPCLDLSDGYASSLLGINYHSDNKTYGSVPGDFGYNAHVALVAKLDAR